MYIHKTLESGQGSQMEARYPDLLVDWLSAARRTPTPTGFKRRFVNIFYSLNIYIRALVKRLTVTISVSVFNNAICFLKPHAFYKVISKFFNLFIASTFLRFVFFFTCPDSTSYWDLHKILVLFLISFMGHYLWMTVLLVYYIMLPHKIPRILKTNFRRNYLSALSFDAFVTVLIQSVILSTVVTSSIVI
jgi:hypothetical protein